MEDRAVIAMGGPRSRLRCLPCLLLCAGAAAAFTYPECPPVSASDFVVDTLVRRGTGTETQEPLKMAFSTDAAGNVDIYFTQRYGRIRKYRGATGTAITLADFAYGADSVNTGAYTQGLHGIALDPGFRTNGWIYLYAAIGTNTAAGSVWRISRYRISGETLDLSSEKTIWRMVTPSYSQHMGGAMRFDQDGNLWFSVADNGGVTVPTSFSAANPYQAANTNSYLGKILRIRPRPLPDDQPAPPPGAGSTYDIPEGNLFPPGTDKTLPEIYVMGTRNAYTISLDRGRGGVAWGDVGPDNFGTGSTNPAQATEEFNLAASPGNYGWPWWAGNQIALSTQPAPAGSTPEAPINNRSDNTGLTNLPPARPAVVPYGRNCAVTGPVYYYDPGLASTAKFPPHFHGAWFVGDFNRNWIDAVALNAAGTQVVDRVKLFAPAGTAGYLLPTPALPSSNGLLELEMGPDGALYVMNYAGYRSSSSATGILRIRYRGSCLPNSVSLASHRMPARPVAALRGTTLEVTATGRHRAEVRDPAGRLLWARDGSGPARYDLREAGERPGIRILTVQAGTERFVRTLAR